LSINSNYWGKTQCGVKYYFNAMKNAYEFDDQDFGIIEVSLNEFYSLPDRAAWTPVMLFHKKRKEMNDAFELI
jgi:hypothetical protein